MRPSAVQASRSCANAGRAAVAAQTLEGLAIVVGYDHAGVQREAGAPRAQPIAAAHRVGDGGGWRTPRRRGLGSFLASNIEDWRNAIFALLLFSVVVGLPEGLMGFASAALARLFRVAPPALPPPAPLDVVLPARAPDGSVLLRLEGLSRHCLGLCAQPGVTTATSPLEASQDPET